MKMKLFWHKSCLTNAEATLQREREAFLQAVRLTEERLKNMEERVNLYRLQIETAEKRGLDGFDQERFLVKRVTK